jgi:pimeloyl-ACP methyl ester carboxylesterase
MAPAMTARRDWRARHDIVLIDQRGAGRSNPLDCIRNLP